MEKLWFANEIAEKNLNYYQDKINEIVEWINSHEKTHKAVKRFNK